jgi:hypothetical protein
MTGGYGTRRQKTEEVLMYIAIMFCQKYRNSLLWGDEYVNVNSGNMYILFSILYRYLT